MTRTHGAALASAVVVGGSLAGLGVFLGFPTGPSVWFGLVSGLLAGLLLLGASQRADTFHPTDPNAHLADHREAGRTDADHLDVDDGDAQRDAPYDAPHDAQPDADDRNDDPPAGDTRG
ncbi:MAG: hypothetical protein R6U94_02460 [Nitriliruptoraceae bacterium]